MNAIKSNKPLSSDEEKELAARIQAGHNADGTLTTDATDARDELVMANLGLVFSQTQKWYEISPWLVEDLEQFGLEKLVQTASSFDPNHGKFSTHAYAQIGWALGRYADAQRSSIHVPVRQCQANRKEERAGGIPDRRSILSLERLTPKQIPHPLVALPEENPAAEERVDLLLENSGLTPLQKQVIGLVYGLTVNPRYTRQEVSELLGTSAQAVGRIVKRALAKMKNSQMVMAA